MKITKTSPLTGITRTLDIDVTEEQLTAWRNGELIQNAMPHLSADEREFLISGIAGDEWDAEFNEQPEDLYEDPYFEDYPQELDHQFDYPESYGPDYHTWRE